MRFKRKKMDAHNIRRDEDAYGVKHDDTGTQFLSSGKVTQQGNRDTHDEDKQVISIERMLNTFRLVKTKIHYKRQDAEKAEYKGRPKYNLEKTRI